MSEKIFLKLNFDFFEVWGCMRVCVCLCDPWGLQDKSVVFLSNISGFRNFGRYCFLFCKGPILNDIRGHSDPKNICQIAENRIYFFKIFWGRPPDPPPALAPSALGSGLRPLPGPPFQNFWIRPWWYTIKMDYTIACGAPVWYHSLLSECTLFVSLQRLFAFSNFLNCCTIRSMSLCSVTNSACQFLIS